MGFRNGSHDPKTGTGTIFQHQWTCFTSNVIPPPNLPYHRVYLNFPSHIGSIVYVGTYWQTRNIHSGRCASSLNEKPLTWAWILVASRLKMNCLIDGRLDGTWHWTAMRIHCVGVGASTTRRNMAARLDIIAAFTEGRCDSASSITFFITTILKRNSFSYFISGIFLNLVCCKRKKTTTDCPIYNKRTFLELDFYQGSLGFQSRYQKIFWW